jgi:hypothetical protein
MAFWANWCFEMCRCRRVKLSWKGRRAASPVHIRDHAPHICLQHLMAIMLLLDDFLKIGA